MSVLTVVSSEPTLEEILRRLPVTLIVGFICEDGVLLAADDESMVEANIGLPQRQARVRKLKRIGLNCVAGLTGNANVGWKALSDLADEYSIEAEINAEHLTELLWNTANEKFRNVREISFVVAGFKPAQSGPRKVIYEVNRPRGEQDNDFEIWEPRSRIYAGVRQTCQFLEEYLPAEIKTLEQAQRAASILIQMTSNDVVGGVGNVGSIAHVTEQGCEIFTDTDFLVSQNAIGTNLDTEFKELLRHHIMQND